MQIPKEEVTAPSQKKNKEKTKRWIYAPCMKEERCKTKIQKLAKNKFARSLQVAAKKRTIVAMTPQAGQKELIKNNCKDVIANGFRGEYLPLKVWETKGYDPKLIEENCTDTYEDPVAGLCYCVNVGSKSDFEGRRKEYKDTLSNGNSSGGNAAAPKKGTNGAADRKLQRNKALGKSICSKIKPGMWDIASVLKKKEFKSIDQATQKSITDLNKKLKLYEKKAENATQTGEDIDCTLEEVLEKVKEAIHAAGLVDKMIGTQIALAAMQK